MKNLTNMKLGVAGIIGLVLSIGCGGDDRPVCLDGTWNESTEQCDYDIVTGSGGYGGGVYVPPGSGGSGNNGNGGSGNNGNGGSGNNGSGANNGGLATNDVKYYALNTSDDSYDGERENFANCGQLDDWRDEFKTCYMSDSCRSEMDDSTHDGRFYLLGDGDIMEDNGYYSPNANMVKCWAVTRYDSSCGAGFEFESNKHGTDPDDGSRIWLSHFDMKAVAPDSPSTCPQGNKVPVTFDAAGGDECPLFLVFCARHDGRAEWFN